MSQENYLFTSESVTEGHPDKVADQISDAVVDAVIAAVHGQIHEDEYAVGMFFHRWGFHCLCRSPQVTLRLCDDRGQLRNLQEARDGACVSLATVAAAELGQTVSDHAAAQLFIVAHPEYRLRQRFGTYFFN